MHTRSTTAIRRLRVAYLTGAAIDAVMGVLMLIPARMGEVQATYPMALGASLMFGWTALLLWANQRPLERRGVLLLTILLILLGLIPSGIWAVAAGHFPIQKILPSSIVALSMAALMGFSYRSSATGRRSSCRPTRWGSTADERAMPMPGDEYLEGGPSARTVMTRAVSIDATPQQVWPWIAQLGRGGGYYSVDWLDNGRRMSASHVVSWIPEPRLGDATAIGYLRHLEPGKSMAWWVGNGEFLGARVRLVSSYMLRSEDSGTRLVSRMSADGTGVTIRLALGVFMLIDSIMATRQLTNLRDRVHHNPTGNVLESAPEAGSRDQYQHYEVWYANGERAGTPGKEHGARWRRSAIEDGVLSGATR